MQVSNLHLWAYISNLIQKGIRAAVYMELLLQFAKIVSALSHGDSFFLGQ